MIIDVILANSDRYQVKALVAKSNVQLLAFQAKVVNAEMVVTADVDLYKVKVCYLVLMLKLVLVMLGLKWQHH